MPVWSPFGGRLTAAPVPFNKTWGLLDRVQHVTHETLARRIVEDNTITPGLVGEGLLLKSRRRVTWVSPNTWDAGARYGSVEFTFDWLSLFGGRSLMWVEHIKYGLQTVRLLLTDSPTDWLSLGLLAYDPATDDGPVQLFGGDWFRRRDIVVEIMIDGEIPLSACLELGFVKHHPKYCSLKRTDCVEVSNHSRTTARILGHILGGGLHSADHALASGIDPIGGLSQALSNLWFALRAGEWKGPVSDLGQAKIVAKSASALAGQGQFDAAKQALHLIDNENLALEALINVVRDHFRQPGMKLD